MACCQVDLARGQGDPGGRVELDHRGRRTPGVADARRPPGRRRTAARAPPPTCPGASCDEPGQEVLGQQLEVGLGALVACDRLGDRVGVLGLEAGHGLTLSGGAGGGAQVVEQRAKRAEVETTPYAGAAAPRAAGGLGGRAASEASGQSRPRVYAEQQPPPPVGWGAGFDRLNRRWSRSARGCGAGWSSSERSERTVETHAVRREPAATTRRLSLSKPRRWGAGFDRLNRRWSRCERVRG